VPLKSYLWLKKSFKEYSQKNLNTLLRYMFFGKIHSYRKKEISKGDFLSRCGAQLIQQVVPNING
jgi:hypothetical protein